MSDEKTFTASEVKAFVEQLQLNAAQSDTFRARMAAAVSGGYPLDDSMHNVYLDFGYPQTLTFYQLWNMYRRFGIAAAVVTLPIDTCWLKNPEIEAPEPFMKELNRLIDEKFLIQRVRALDLRQRVGRYGAMFMQVKDGKKLSDPIDGPLPGVDMLVKMVPLFEGQLTPATYDTDEQSERFGLPTTYQYTSSAVGGRDNSSGVSMTIHWTRLVIAAEGADDGGIYGVPALESVYNSLMDLRKIIGSGGEGFYRNAAHRTVMSPKDTASAAANSTLLDGINEQFDDFLHNMSRRAMWVPGMDVTALQSNLVSNAPHFDAALNDVAAGSGIPATILIGKQTGRLASAEDARHFLSSMNSRNENFTITLFEDVIDWCIRYGVLPAKDYEVEFDDLLTRSDKEKVEVVLDMAEANRRQFQAGGSAVFTEDEIREAADLEPMAEQDLPDETLPEDVADFEDEQTGDSELD